MKININTNNLELNDALKKYVSNKIGSLKKVVKRFEEKGEVKIFLELSRTTNHHKSGDVYYAEANVELDGDLIRVEHKDEDIRVSIDQIKDILQRKIRDKKEREVSRKRQAKRPGKPKK
ncbi:MAG: ribosome-associated translation inhibitor RaiA [Candidatus Paceibacterota bacterium]